MSVLTCSTKRRLRKFRPAETARKCTVKRMCTCKIVLLITHDVFEFLHSEFDLFRSIKDKITLSEKNS